MLTHQRPKQGVSSQVMMDSQLQRGAEGPDVPGLIFWARSRADFNEVAFLVMAPTTINIQTATLYMKLGATDLLTKPVMREVLFKLRKVVGDSQNMQQQRNTRKVTSPCPALPYPILPLNRLFPTLSYPSLPYPSPPNPKPSAIRLQRSGPHPTLPFCSDPEPEVEPDSSSLIEAQVGRNPVLTLP